MELINPIGRVVSLGVEEITPYACMCSAYDGNFSGALGSNDTCWHCGCDCSGSGNRNSGNTQRASRAPGVSKWTD